MRQSEPQRLARWLVAITFITITLYFIIANYLQPMQPPRTTPRAATTYTEDRADIESGRGEWYDDIIGK